MAFGERAEFGRAVHAVQVDAVRADRVEKARERVALEGRALEDRRGAAAAVEIRSLGEARGQVGEHGVAGVRRKDELET